MINKFDIDKEDSIIPERMASASYNSEEDAAWLLGLLRGGCARKIA